MELSRFRECLASDYDRMRSVVAGGDRAAKVPSCPDWTLADLTDHTAFVFMHKTGAMRDGVESQDYPPTLPDPRPAPLDLLAEAYAGLIAEFDRHQPQDAAGSWYTPDQTVSFWIRRMAQETVIHRVDAELAAGVPIAPIPDDLAADGIDEVLKVFLEFTSEAWNKYFDLAEADGRPIEITADGRSWLVRPTPERVLVTDGGGGAVARVSGTPTEVLLWAWRRAADDTVTIDGDAEAVRTLRHHLGTATQ